MSPGVGKIFLASTPYLRITPNSCLNDPFEIRLSAATKKQIDLLDKNSFSNDGRSTSMKFEEFMRRHGVISFSKTYDNLLMWSHYSNYHKGIAVEFDIDIKSPFSLFNTGYVSTASDIKFSKVKYRKRRGYPSAFTEADISTVAEHYYLTKSKEWRYEKEYRFIVPFTMANKILVNLDAKKAKVTLKRLGITLDEHVKEPVIDVTNELLMNSDWESLACAFENSHENGFMFLICINETKISRLFLGANSDISMLSSLIGNAYGGSPYVSYRSIEGEYMGVYKGVVHDNRFEVGFELLQEL